MKIITAGGNGENKVVGKFRCSECGAEFITDEWKWSNFSKSSICPCCGNSDIKEEMDLSWGSEEE